MSEYIITDEQIAENRRLHDNKLLVMPVIVRCRDCEHFYCLTIDCCVCKRNGEKFMPWVEPDGFCAWGERETNNKTGDFVTHGSGAKAVGE